jgi:NAD(P)-dependent dehydrogenase (short-subunit alcohol dehydrogenase family)
VLITGATSGVGLATAKQFVSAGVTKLMIVGRNEDRGRKALDAVRALAPKARIEFLSADVRSVEQALSTVQRATDALGSVDVLVNSTVSPYTPELLHNSPIESIGPTLVEQALAPMLMCRAVLPSMRERRGGAIINIASDAAKVPTPGETVLGAAMAAIVMFSRTLAMEAKRDGIRVNTLTPSLIAATGSWDRNMDKGGFSQKLFERVAKLAHLGLTQPEDLAALIVFLASPEAAHITAQVISVNSGISAG